MLPGRGHFAAHGDLNGTKVKDFSPLKGMPLTRLALGGTKLRDLELVKGMPLKVLEFHDTKVTNLTPLKGMPLGVICQTPKNITRGLDMLRDMKSLKTIGIDRDQSRSAAEFWERYDKGEFKWSRSRGCQRPSVPPSLGGMTPDPGLL
jgi:hypothetical protein